MNDFGKRLKTLRKSTDVTQEQLVRAISQRHSYDWLKNDFDFIALLEDRRD